MRLHQGVPHTMVDDNDDAGRTVPTVLPARTFDDTPCILPSQRLLQKHAGQKSTWATNKRQRIDHAIATFTNEIKRRVDDDEDYVLCDNTGKSVYAERTLFSMSLDNGEYDLSGNGSVTNLMYIGVYHVHTIADSARSRVLRAMTSLRDAFPGTHTPAHTHTHTHHTTSS